MDNREQTSPAQGENTRGYTVDELLAQMEPQYQAYKNTMRQCIAGLTEHAARLAAQGQEEQLPTFRRLLTDMAEFWGLAEDDTPKGYREMVEQIGSTFDQAVSAARDSGGAPELSEQTRQNILSGLELYAQEMRANDEELEQWAAECDSLAGGLKKQWYPAQPGMEMSKSDFWELIAGAKKECGQNMDASSQWLAGQLIARGPQQTQDFHDILNGYLNLSYQYGLWTAASLMCENGCSDDGFIDFRAWLIAQGEEVYMAALADPDSLADVEAYGGCQFEELLYTGNETMKHLTGKDAYENTDPDAYKALVAELRKGITYGEGVDYPYEWDEVEEYLPRLCEKYLEPCAVEFHLKSHHMSSDGEEGIDFLNQMAQRLADLKPNALTAYKALLEATDCKDILSAGALMDSLDNYVFSPQYSSPIEVAKGELSLILCEPDAATLAPHLNLYQYGQALIEKCGGVLTPYGLIEPRGPHMSPAERVMWGAEEQGSERSFRLQAETEVNGLCDDAGQPVQGMEESPQQGGMEMK